MVFLACCSPSCEESKLFRFFDFNWTPHGKIALTEPGEDIGLPPGLGSHVSFVRYVGLLANCFLDYFINEWGEAYLISPR